MTAEVRGIATPEGTGLLHPHDWSSIEPFAELVDARDGSVPRDRTLVRAAASASALHVRFDCTDRDIWSTQDRRDAPLWEEEVVEVFLAPGAADPERYVEIEISPAGVLFDALVANPDGERATMRVDTAFVSRGLVGRVGRPGRDRWSAELAIPWPALAPLGAAFDVWRANFYRIERPRGEEPQFSACRPRGAEPADFHKPAHFGRLEIRWA